MSSTETDLRPILIAGPTASGKSALAMAIAEQIGGTIVNADSMQVYRELRILTARPTPADEARVPHALYGFVPSEMRQRRLQAPRRKDGGLSSSGAPGFTSRHCSKGSHLFPRSMKTCARIGERRRHGAVQRRCMQSLRRGMKSWRGGFNPRIRSGSCVRSKFWSLRGGRWPSGKP
jgi:hypothetical protein